MVGYIPACCYLEVIGYDPIYLAAAREWLVISPPACCFRVVVYSPVYPLFLESDSLQPCLPSVSREWLVTVLPTLLRMVGYSPVYPSAARKWLLTGLPSALHHAISWLHHAQPPLWLTGLKAPTN